MDVYAVRVCVLLTRDYPQINLFLVNVLQCGDFLSCRELPVYYPLAPEAPRPTGRPAVFIAESHGSEALNVPPP